MYLITLFAAKSLAYLDRARSLICADSIWLFGVRLFLFTILSLQMESVVA